MGILRGLLNFANEISNKYVLQLKRGRNRIWLKLSNSITNHVDRVFLAFLCLFLIKMGKAYTYLSPKIYSSSLCRWVTICNKIIVWKLAAKEEVATG